MTAPVVTKPANRPAARPGGRKPRSGVDDWWTVPDTVPAADSATVKKTRRWRRLVTVYVWAAVILLPLTLLALFVLAGQQLAGHGSATDKTVSGTQEAAQAQVLLERWIGQNPSPLPGGRVVALIDATSQTPAPAHPGEVVDYRIATYRFVIADRADNLYTTGVQLAITPDGPVLLARPALLPIPATGTTAQGGQWPWPGVEAGTPQAAYGAAVNAWLAAYTSGDPAALKQAVGDPDPSRSYLTLSGVKLSSPAIGPVGYLWGPGQDSGKDALPQQALLRVTVGASWTGQTPAPGGTVPTLTYDLLLDKADTAAPVVVAW
ncbi:hypothetical protein, partial [Microlunatus ginsengisoli]|uniref:hypothetical protein n=1 Tax=Microlunatus ginsengisoli TaxID=363863 RepID=UPI0031D95A7C